MSFRSIKSVKISLYENKKLLSSNKIPAHIFFNQNIIIAISKLNWI